MKHFKISGTMVEGDNGATTMYIRTKIETKDDLEFSWFR